jgi:hypothetical protein
MLSCASLVAHSRLGYQVSPHVASMESDALARYSAIAGQHFDIWHRRRAWIDPEHVGHYSPSAKRSLVTGQYLYVLQQALVLSRCRP